MVADLYICRSVYMAVMQQKIEIDAILLGILKNRLFIAQANKITFHFEYMAVMQQKIEIDAILLS